MILQNSIVLLVDEAGKKLVLHAMPGMVDVRGLGVVDGTKICGASYGDLLTIGTRSYRILKPTVRDLLDVIERKAQIMVPKDSFIIPMYLDLSAGSMVLEGGVGSGALAIVLLKAVSPNGRVCSYELRKDHADVARRNVAMAGLEDNWELKLEDVRTAKLEPGFDAAVLDMPNPCDALENVIRAVKVGGCICGYVPNTNQLEMLVNGMRTSGLGEVFAFETIQREMVVHKGGVRPSFEMLGHTGYLAFGRKMRG